MKTNKISYQAHVKDSAKITKVKPLQLPDEHKAPKTKTKAQAEAEPKAKTDAKT